MKKISKKIDELINIMKSEEKDELLEVINEYLSKLNNIDINSNTFKNDFKLIRKEGLKLVLFFDEDNINKFYEYEKEYQKILFAKDNIDNLVEALNKIKLTSINPKVFQENMRIIKLEEDNIENKGVRLENVLNNSDLNKYIAVCKLNSSFYDTKNKLSNIDNFKEIKTVKEFDEYLLSNKYLTVYDYVNLLELKRLLKSYDNSLDKFMEILKLTKIINKPALLLYYRFNLKQRTNKNEEVYGLLKYLRDYPKYIIGTDKINSLTIKKDIENKRKEEEKRHQEELNKLNQLEQEFHNTKEVPTIPINISLNNEKIDDLFKVLNQREKDELCYLVLLLYNDYCLKQRTQNIDNLTIINYAKNNFINREPKVSIISNSSIKRINSKLTKKNKYYYDIIGLNLNTLNLNTSISEYAYIKTNNQTGIKNNHEIEKYKKKLDKMISKKYIRKGLFGKEQISELNLEELKRLREIVNKEFKEELPLENTDSFTINYESEERTIQENNTKLMNNIRDLFREALEISKGKTK